MRVAVFGAGGLLGQAAVADARARGDSVLALTHAECDVADASAVSRALVEHRPALVINAAAFTDVDRAERDADEAARANAEGPAVLARAASEVGARLVHVSTDYVFDGTKDAPYGEEDAPRPISAYARTKLAGEAAALAAAPLTIIARSAWVYGPGGKNFVSKIPEILLAKGEIAAVADQWSSPTRADELARALREIAPAVPGGVYHVAASGAASYHECALEAAKVLGIDATRVRPTEGAALVRPARRPRYTALRSTELPKHGVKPLRPWQEAYREYVAGLR